MARKKYLILAKAYDKKGRLLASSWNNYRKSHTYMAAVSERAGVPLRIYLHSEVSALLRCRDKQVYRLTVERYNQDGSPALARPCEACQQAIKDFGVQVVEYTTENGWVTEGKS
jgi:cytidine deaminase